MRLLFFKSTTPLFKIPSLPQFISFFYLLTVSLLPTQLGKHFWPDFSYINGLRSDYLSPTIYTTDLTLVILSLLTLISLVKKRKTFKSFNIICSFSPFLLTSIVAVVVGIILSSQQLLGVIGVLRLFEMIFFGLFTKRFLGLGKKNLRYVFVAIAASLILESCLSIWQISLQHSVGGVFYFFGERTFTISTPGIADASLNGNLFLRPYGTFSHPNTLAAFLLITSFVLINVISTVKKSFELYALRIIAFVGFVCVCLTLSRVGILILLFSSIVYLLSIGKKSMNIKKIFTGFLLLIIFVLSFSPLLVPRFLSRDFLSESLLVRISLGLTALQMIMKQPFFGVGIGQYLPSVKDFSERLNGFSYEPVHNTFLLFAAETGILGLAGFVGIIWRGLMLSIKNKNRIALLLMLPIIVFGFSDHFFLTQQQGRLLISFALGIVFAKDNVRQPFNEKYSKKAR